MKSILLVEDSRFLRLANERTLVKAGYSVVTAGDGEEALRIANATIPDLILLDMLLPTLGGVQVLQALRSNVLTALIPVVVLSSLPQKNEFKLKKEGATAYFEKSQLDLGQNSESLINIVKKTLDDFTELNGHGLPAVEVLSSRFVRESQT
jgi:CheY-like chemotaxis protein